MVNNNNTVIDVLPLSGFYFKFKEYFMYLDHIIN
jgi:hypothetical protein